VESITSECTYDMNLRPHPPEWISKLLRVVCKDDLFEEIEGDLLEFYDEWVTTLGRKKANQLYAWHALKFLRPFAIKRFSSKPDNQIMLRNYLKVAWRSLRKNKMFSTIKVGGFAIGIAAFTLISFFILDELNYDKHYENGNRIYRIANDYKGEEKWTSFPGPAAEIIRSNYPGIEKVGRLIPQSGWFQSGDNQLRTSSSPTNFYEEGFAYADPELLAILEIPMVYGNQEEALSVPRSIVISERKAQKYFPNQDPVGQTIILNDNLEEPYVVGGVMKNFPSQSHIDFDYLITLYQHEFWPGEQTNWCCWNYNIYVRLKSTTNPEQLEEQLLTIRDYVAQYQERNNPSQAEDTKKHHTFILQPVADIYLKSDDIYDSGKHGNLQIVWLFVAIATLVLLLACVNFINLSTAKSANRSKEVGVRKVLGSRRKNLIQQFLTESFLICFVSVSIGISLAALFLPSFNEVAQKSLSIPFLSWWFIPGVLGFILLITFFSGLYPSFYLSAFRPVDVLKSSLSQGSKNSRLRSVMVVFQFSASIVLMVSALLVYRQLDFILNKDVGFDREQVVVIQGVGTMGEKSDVFKNELKTLSNVRSVSLSNFIPISGTKRDGNGFWLEGRQDIDKQVGTQRWTVDGDYIETMGMNLLEGRNFGDMVQDSSSIIINQALASKLNLQEPIGARIENYLGTWTVIGLIQDFHFESMKMEIEPLALCPTTNGAAMIVKLQSEDLKESLTDISAKWDNLMPNQPIRYTFLDDSFEIMYENVTRAAIVFAAFAVLALIVACLGLFGLSAFMVEQRRKEISIRKVFGASLQNIFNLLTFNFLKMIVLSLVIAIPFSLVIMSRWLEDFEYAVGISWDVYLIAGITITVISLVTVSFESLRAGLINPTRGLKEE